MGVKKKIMKIKKVCVTVLAIMLLTGCGKSFTDYPNKWVSTEYHIEIDPNKKQR